MGASKGKADAATSLRTICQQQQPAAAEAAVSLRPVVAEKPDFPREDRCGTGRIGKSEQKQHLAERRSHGDDPFSIKRLESV